MTGENGTSPNYYVYTYAYENGSIFYIGKGTGGRIDEHEMEAKRGCGCAKCQVIREIWNNGGVVQKQIVFWADLESEALEHERALIQKHASTLLTNSLYNSQRRRNESAEKVLWANAIFSEKIVDGIAYVSLKDLRQALSMKDDRLKRYMAYLHLNQYYFPFIRGAYVTKVDAERIRQFLLDRI